MPGSNYRYANSYVLINKLGITDDSELFQAEQHCENNVSSVFLYIDIICHSGLIKSESSKQ